MYQDNGASQHQGGVFISEDSNYPFLALKEVLEMKMSVYVSVCLCVSAAHHALIPQDLPKDPQRSPKEPPFGAKTLIVLDYIVS